MNLPTIIVLVIIAVLFAAVIINEIRKRRNGKGGCGCGCDSCGGCAIKDICHEEKEKEDKK